MWSKTCTFQPTQLRLRRESQWIMVQSTTLHCLNEIPKGMVCSWWMFGCCEEIRPLCVCKSEATCQKKLFLQLNTAWHKKNDKRENFREKGSHSHVSNSNSKHLFGGKLKSNCSPDCGDLTITMRHMVLQLHRIQLENPRRRLPKKRLYRTERSGESLP